MAASSGNRGGGRPRRPDGASRGRGERADGARRRRMGREPSPRPAAHGRSGNRGDTRGADARKRTPAKEPELPAHVDISLLDRSVRSELRSLSKPNADAVAAHLVVAGQALDSSPTKALEHARAARARAARVAVVREAVGVAAYHAEQWAEARAELRAARRISGDARNLAIIADCERALGRPEQAVRALDDPGFARLDAATRTEVLIVVAGARRDMGQTEAALAVLARGGLDRDRPRPGSERLWYAYADALTALERTEEAATWFAASAELDHEGQTDAAQRAAALL